MPESCHDMDPPKGYIRGHSDSSPQYPRGPVQYRSPRRKGLRHPFSQRICRTPFEWKPLCGRGSYPTSSGAVRQRVDWCFFPCLSGQRPLPNRPRLRQSPPWSRANSLLWAIYLQWKRDEPRSSLCRWFSNFSPWVLWGFNESIIGRTSILTPAILANERSWVNNFVGWTGTKAQAIYFMVIPLS